LHFVLEIDSTDSFRNGYSAANTSPRSALRQDSSVQTSSLTRCVVQLELVDAVNNILFGRNAFRVEGPVKRSPSVVSSNHVDVNSHSPTSLNDDVSNCLPMFEHVPNELLVDVVNEMVRAHEIAREFSTNVDQRTVLMKAAFKGKCKPNLQKQETHAIHCALNMLFRLYAESEPQSKQMEQFKTKLIR
jgi:brefeldin A-inhibited guanine nucleotide-exchange protein